MSLENFFDPTIASGVGRADPLSVNRDTCQECPWVGLWEQDLILGDQEHQRRMKEDSIQQEAKMIDLLQVSSICSLDSRRGDLCEALE